ncbi:hypothetical protein HGRIS_012541 [Hohenbuehelia grisea]|uniref:Hikeshi-like domain-containing protein n=1 Tax=Hohenbuehelia grisea TaxID=104357 RepID=A0ABR3ISL0_9AGAR
MFGCCVAGRLLQTNLQQVDDTHAYFELPAASTINHICVFLLGTVPFPDGYGASVHFYWPGKGFQLLGMLSNDKPSAIFRLRGSFTSNATMANPHAFTSGASALGADPSSDVTAVLGLAMEPLAEIQQQISGLPMAIAKPAQDITKDTAALAERVVKHLFNYISSFLSGGASVAPDVAVPMSIIAKWYESFVAKLRAGGVGFLDRGD